eukprot:UN4954
MPQPPLPRACSHPSNRANGARMRDTLLYTALKNTHWPVPFSRCGTPLPPPRMLWHSWLALTTRETPGLSDSQGP